MRWELLLWLFYLAGQGLHIWLRASLAVASSLNSVATLRAYLRLKGLVLACRIFLETCAFLAFEYGGTSWFSLPNGGSHVSRVGLAGVFGYAADAILDQIFAKVGLDKELPPRP